MNRQGCKNITTEDYINWYKNTFPDNFDILDFSKFNYVTAKGCSVVINKYGDCLIKPTHLSQGSIPNIQSAIDKNEYFKNMAIEKRKEGFDYSKTNFKNMYSKVIITCPIHGDFDITPANHLYSVTGCGQCGNEKVFEINKSTPTGWSFKRWEEMGKKSKEFDNFKLYIIVCTRDDEMFYKIGKTYKALRKRFIKSRMPYNYTILYLYSDSAENISNLEKYIQRINKNGKYLPKIHFDGKYECYINLNKRTWDFIRKLATPMEVFTQK